MKKIIMQKGRAMLSGLEGIPYNILGNEGSRITREKVKMLNDNDDCCEFLLMQNYNASEQHYIQWQLLSRYEKFDSSRLKKKKIYLIPSTGSFP